MPTSTTTAPGFTMSAVTNFGWPMATIRMSASRVTAARSRVRLWQSVTVASPPGPRCDEHDRQRPAHDVAAADDHHVPAGDFDAAAHQQLLHALRRAGQEPRPALHQPADVLRMKRVDVLRRAHGQQHAVRIDLRRQRQLHQDAVDRLVLVQLGDQLEQLVGRGARRQAVQLAFDADRLARLALVADVDFAGRIVAHEHRGQARHDAVVLNELDHLLGQLRANLLGQAACRRESWRAWRGRESRVESREPLQQRSASAYGCG